MRKRILITVLSVIYIFVCSICLFACSDKDEESGNAKTTYYLYEDGQIDKSQFIVIYGNKWRDDDGANGTCKISNGNIVFYAEVFGSNEEMYSGTLVNGVLTVKILGATMTFYQEGRVPSGGQNSNGHTTHDWAAKLTSTDAEYHWYACSGCTEKKDYEKHNYVDGKCVCGKESLIKNDFDVTFYLNYEGAAPEVHSTTNKLVAYIPTRAGYDFNGWYVDSDLLQLFDMDKEVSGDGLVLHASWVETTTEVGQLSAPIVSVNEEIFAWKNIVGATGYRIVVTKAPYNESVIDKSVNSTIWEFPQSLEAGKYTVKIRAIGDGISTVNSVYTSKNYSLRVLGDVSGIVLDKATSVLSWNEVANAETYQVYINKSLAAEQGENSLDISNYDAGMLEVRVCATKENWLTSLATVNISKMRLKTPQIEVSVAPETNSYVLEWDGVLYADKYILKYGNSEIIINNTTYSINNNSAIWGGQTTVTFVINAFDSSADYLISTGGKEITIGKLYNFTAGKSVEEAGGVSIEGDVWSINRGTNCVVSGNEYTLIAKTTDERYVFEGWYHGEKLLSDKQDYTFTMPAKNIEYIAKWKKCTVTMLKNIDEAGIISSYNDTPVKAGESITIFAQSNLGYDFIGWYNGENKLSDGAEYTFTMPLEEIMYTAKWRVKPEMSIFEFTSTQTTLCITSVIDKSISHVSIPDYVTSIGEYAFWDRSSLTSITIGNSVTSIEKHAFA